MPDREPIPDSELPAELPERFVGKKIMDVHYNYGRDGGGGIYTWLGQDGRVWPIQEQYDTRKPKPATAKKPAFEPARTGVVIVDRTQPDGFYGEVCSSYRELRETWKRWRLEREAAARGAPASIEAGLVCQACAGDAPRGKCLTPNCVGSPIVRERVPAGVAIPLKDQS